MKILRLISSIDPRIGGPIEGIRSISRVLAGKGHETSVAYFWGSPKGDDTFFPLRIQPSWTGYGYSPSLVPWLRANAGDFDAVIVHGLWQYHGLGVWRALKGGNVPYFVYPHGMLDPWFKGQYPLKHLKKSIYWSLFESKVLRDASAVLFTSDEERRLAQLSFGSCQHQEEVVPYGVSRPTVNLQRAEETFKKAYPIVQNHPFLLFMGRLHPKKGCDLLIEAFSRVYASRSEQCLVMAGPDQMGWQKDLVVLAKKRGLEGRVIWTGHLEDELKWGAIGSAEAMILPSHQENFGIAVAEALACTRPVLISDKVNIWREVVEYGAGHVAPDDVMGVTSLLSRWKEASEEARRVMSISAERCFRERFEIAHVAKGFLEVLKKYNVKN